MYDKLYFIMDSEKTVKYKFSPKYVYGLDGHNYGYICGGQDTGIIDRISFSFDQGNTVQVGELSDIRNETTANNSSTHGYICGGKKAGVPVRTIDRIFYPLDSGNALDFSGMIERTFASSANNSTCFGYICGGKDNNDITTDNIERFRFSLSSITTSLVSTLTNNVHYSASNNSSTYGYTCGGLDSLTTNIINRFSFNVDIGVSSNIGTLNNEQAFSGGNNSTNYGYICGGNFDSINRINFAADSGLSHLSGTLEDNREFVSANNSTTHGYVCGGDNSNIINRFAFPLDSGTAVSYSELTTSSRTQSSATDGTDGVTLFTPISTGPGPSGCDSLIYDTDTDTGYFGLFNDFITGQDLITHLNITEGTLINSDTAWMKFISEGKILFVPQKPILSHVSWKAIYEAGAVFGTDDNGPYNAGTDVLQDAQIQIGDYSFRIRLLTGATTNPASTEWDCSVEGGGGMDSEWNNLIYRVHESIIECSGATNYHGGPQIGDNWAEYTDSDLGIGDMENDGVGTLTQEIGDSDTRVRRGAGSIVAYFAVLFDSI
ncbi:MAG: hypothetical protein ACOCZ5_00770, partial [bacterium]